MKYGLLPCATLLLLALAPAHGAGLSATVTGADGAALEDAVVYATPVKSGAALSPPKSIEIDQRNKMFEPAVSVVQTGGSASFPNSDNIRHQVYSFSPPKVFNIKLYSGRPSDPVTFDKPGVVVLGCNIHDRMVAWVLVVDTPWFARSDPTGRAEIKELPAGEYELSYWHPALRGDPVTRRVQIAADVRHEETLQLNAVNAKQTGHEAHGGGISR